MRFKLPLPSRKTPIMCRSPFKGQRLRAFMCKLCDSHELAEELCLAASPPSPVKWVVSVRGEAQVPVRWPARSSDCVLCFSELFFYKEPHNVNVMRKDPVILDCQARGDLPISMKWLKNGVKVVENDRVYALSNGSLYIAEVESKAGDKSDEGFYQCLAQNKYGAILSQKSRLTVASK
ncbi:PRTG protein, partial [Polypterus senegalus]|nr:PRTG protein [Polypterus senegalus]